MSRGRVARSIALLLFGGGCAIWVDQGWMACKARVAGWLIDRAYAAHLEDGRRHPPWSWADTWPLARLDVPRLGVRRTVLAGASGSSLAFGPGHVDGTSPPNGGGNAVIAGHRDSSFAFLEHLRPGDAIDVTTRDAVRRYRVTDASVTSMWDSGVTEPTLDDRLTLVTCYPFGGLTRSSLRYVVSGRPEGPRRGRPSAGGVSDASSPAPRRDRGRFPDVPLG